MPSEPIFLASQRLTLRPLAARDAAGPYPCWLNDGEVCRGNSHHTRPYSRDQARAYIEQANRSENPSVILAIMLRRGRRHIGNLALTQVHPIHRTAEFTILLGDASQWGRGYGREAAQLLIAHGFTALNLRRIHCGTLASNQAFIRLAAALGMRREGIRRQAVFKNGAYVDVVEFGLLREECAFLSSS
ncbi:MAG TPA: GNAT family protein [Opitutaceae bacterium]|nr:GNAT family protein [Opitutaceae bacterium]